MTLEERKHANHFLLQKGDESLGKLLPELRLTD